MIISYVTDSTGESLIYLFDVEFVELYEKILETKIRVSCRQSNKSFTSNTMVPEKDVPIPG